MPATSMLKQAIIILCSMCISLCITGCSTVSYYLSAIEGQFDVLSRRIPLQQVIADPKTDTRTREKLQQLIEARRFAVTQLHLPDNDSYTQYADLGRDHVVWNIVATPSDSLEPREWCYLVAGCFRYRGYFSKQSAQQEARELRAQGMDVAMNGVSAYSTLGWFDDPILNTMMFNSEAARVGVLFHELAHQAVYRKDDTVFNESFATTVELEGVRRWFAQRGNAEAWQNYQQWLARKNEFQQLLRQYRERLDTLYKSGQPHDEMMAHKAELFAALKFNYRRMRDEQWQGYSGFDGWMNRDLNNAHLALADTYYRLVPAFQALLASRSNDLAGFYAEAKRLSESGNADQQLKQMLQPHGDALPHG